MEMPTQQANREDTHNHSYRNDKAFEQFKEKEGLNLLDTFRIFDKDNNGQITLSELGDVFRACGQNPSDEELEQTKKTWDVNGNGKIEFDDFVHLSFTTFKSVPAMKIALKEAFKVFDKNDDGLINRKELKEVVTTVLKGNEGLAATEEEIDSMLAVADIDQDGCINYEEFCNIILNHENL